LLFLPRPLINMFIADMSGNGEAKTKLMTHKCQVWYSPSILTTCFVAFICAFLERFFRPSAGLCWGLHTPTPVLRRTLLPPPRRLERRSCRPMRAYSTEMSVMGATKNTKDETSKECGMTTRLMAQTLRSASTRPSGSCSYTRPNCRACGTAKPSASSQITRTRRTARESCTDKHNQLVHPGLYVVPAVH